MNIDKYSDDRMQKMQIIFAKNLYKKSINFKSDYITAIAISKNFAK